MRIHEHQPDDTVCDHCGEKLPEKFTPYSWQDHGFCSAICAANAKGTISLAGQAGAEMASKACKYGGPGFERDIVREWLKAGKPNAPALITRRPSEDDSDGQIKDGWTWRLMAAGECYGQRFTSKVRLCQLILTTPAPQR